MTLDEYIPIERQRQLDDVHSERMVAFRAMLQQNLREFGFYTVYCHQLVKDDELISVSMHNLPYHPKIPDELIFHKHDYFELVYVYKGGCHNHFKDSALRLSEGDLLLLNPHVLHALYTTEMTDVVFNIVLSTKLFETSLMPMLTDNHLFSRFFSNYFYQVNQAQDYLIFPAMQAPRIGQILREIMEEYWNRPLGFRHVIQSELVILFASLTRCYSEQHSILPDMGQKAQLIADVLAHINRHCSSITLQEVAETFSYSSNYLSKLILKHTGKSFTDLVRHYRLEKVRSALDHAQLSMDEIVQMSGYNDRSYLDKSFKARFGVTMSQYRKSRPQ